MWKVKSLICEQSLHFHLQFSPSEIGGKEAIEVRGIWDIKNYPMAGPFLTYIINDDASERILVFEGFVFAPATE